MRRFIVLTVVLIAIAVFTVTAIYSTQHPAKLAPDMLIPSVNSANYMAAIFALSDGNLKHIVDGQDFDYSLTGSLVYQSVSYQGLTVISLDNPKSAVVLENTKGAYGPKWSPDGEMIAYNMLVVVKSNELESNQVWINANGIVYIITNPSCDYFWLDSWFDDDNVIVSCRYDTYDHAGTRQPNSDLYLVAYATNVWSRLTNTPSVAESYVSVNSGRILYRSIDLLGDENNDLGIMVLDTPESEPRELATKGTPMWSPDGTEIIYSYSRRLRESENQVDSTGIRIVTADGSNDRLVTKTDGLYYGLMTFSRVDGRIYFVAAPPTDTAGEIYSINSDGSDLRTEAQMSF